MPAWSGALLVQAEKAVSLVLSRMREELGHAGGTLEGKEVTKADRKQELYSQAQGGAKHHSSLSSRVWGLCLARLLAAFEPPKIILGKRTLGSGGCAAT